MMKRYIKHIPSTMNFNWFPYTILFNNYRHEFVIGLMPYKYVKNLLAKTWPMAISKNNKHLLYDAKMSKSMANMIIKELMKCT